MTDKELRTLDEMLTNLEIWSTWNKTFANEMIGICSKMRNLLADRKTENSSEIPNNCEHITEDGVTCAKYPACDDCLDNPLNKVKGSERLLKGKDEPQTCEDCRHNGVKHAYDYACDKCTDMDKFQHEDEPQTQLTAKCLNCNNSKVCKEKHWDGCVYEPKDEKTCETCRHWKYIAHEWQCEACKCQGYEPKDEPQTETSTNSEKVQLEVQLTDEQKVVMPKKCKGCDSASKIIEAYSRGFEDGAEAVKAMPQTGRSE